MQPDEKTQKVADAVTHTIDSQDTSITLATPQVTPAPTEPQPDSDSSDNSTDTSSQSKSHDSEDDKKPATAAGYSIGALANAPSKPPEPTKTEGSEMTSNTKVVIIIGGGALLFLIGILLAVFGFATYGIILVVIAAVLVLLGVFLPIR